MSDSEVQIRSDCERCKGSGRVPGQRFAGGLIVDERSATDPCPDCLEKGKRFEWVPVREFRERFLEGE